MDQEEENAQDVKSDASYLSTAICTEINGNLSHQL